MALLSSILALSAAATASAAPRAGPAAKAAELMAGFADRTGLTSKRPSTRYLWTDAFAVCNYLGLARATGDAHALELAGRLIARVHEELGKHRPDDRRKGWLSGLGEHEGQAHPTSGGLRIGKPLPEHSEGEPYDDRLEWDRDGQYFHYLTKWMHALDQAARATGRADDNAWARELALKAHAAFSYSSGAGRRMHWKMSIDLSRPLVASMGQHDALDGYVTALELRATARRLAKPGADLERLDAAAADFDAMIDEHALATEDPLGLGGLLTDAFHLAQLRSKDARTTKLVAALLDAAAEGVEHYALGGELAAPAATRLAFRELGLAIGLHAARELLRTGLVPHRAALETLARQGALEEKIIQFWLRPESQKAASWTGHRDINEVMLATALAPDGFLVLHGL